MPNIIVECRQCHSTRIGVLWCDPKQVRLQCQACWLSASVAKVKYHRDYTEVAEDALHDAVGKEKGK